MTPPDGRPGRGRSSFDGAVETGAGPRQGGVGMRRIALVLVFAVVAMAFSGCGWNWNDPIHPRVCPKINPCDGCGPCSGHHRIRQYPYP